MKYALLTILVSILPIIFVTCTKTPGSDTDVMKRIDNNPYELVDAGVSEEITANLEPQQTKLDIKKCSNDITKEQMVKDIIQVWELFLQDSNCDKDDPRRKMFPKYADALADAIILYQDELTDISGQLPKHISTHVLMAVIVTKESSIRHDVVGAAPRFEVGLMQLHGVALAGYDPETVQNNYRLGLLLGVRWMAMQMNKCKPYRIAEDSKEFRTDDWLGPISVYAGGPKAINRKTGHCYRYRIARERVNLTKLYMTRIKKRIKV